MVRCDIQGKKMTSLRALCSGASWMFSLSPSPLHSFALLLRSHLWQQAPGCQTECVSVCVRNFMYTWTVWTGNCGHLDFPCVSWTHQPKVIVREKGGSRTFHWLERLDHFGIFLLHIVWSTWCCQRPPVGESRGRLDGGEEEQADFVKAGSLFWPRRLQAAVQPTSLAYSNIYDHFVGRWK